MIDDAIASGSLLEPCSTAPRSRARFEDQVERSLGGTLHAPETAFSEHLRELGLAGLGPEREPHLLGE
jgi:hypothetical protein